MIIRTDKAKSLPIRLQKVVRREILAIARESAEILEAAQSKAESIVCQAEASRDEMERAAFDKGHREGLLQWLSALESCRAREEQRLRELEPELLRLALQIARKIIGAEIQSNPDAYLSMVRQAMQAMPERIDLVIYVPPERLEQVRGQVAGMERWASRIEVRGKAGLGAGDCLLESESGSVDGRLEAKWKLLEEALLRQSISGGGRR